MFLRKILYIIYDETVSFSLEQSLIGNQSLLVVSCVFCVSLSSLAHPQDGINAYGRNGSVCHPPHPLRLPALCPAHLWDLASSSELAGAITSQFWTYYYWLHTMPLGSKFPHCSFSSKSSVLYAMVPSAPLTLLETWEAFGSATHEAVGKALLVWAQSCKCLPLVTLFYLL